MKNILLILLIALLSSCSFSSQYKYKFEAEKWQNDSTEIYRWGMSGDLIANHLEIGMPMDSVLKILGDYQRSGSNSNYRYNLGPCGSGIDMGTLSLFFDEEETLSDMKVSTH